MLTMIGVFCVAFGSAALQDARHTNAHHPDADPAGVVAAWVCGILGIVVGGALVAIG